MQHALIFLIRAICAFFSTLFLLRLIMQWRLVSFASHAGHFVLKLTNWAVLPLRRVVRGWGGVDWASLLAAFAIQLVYASAFYVLLGLNAIYSDVSLFAVSVIIFAAKNFLQTLIYLYIVLLLVQAVLSWVNPYSPLARPLAQLTRPLLAPVQRLIPPIAGIDISPLIVIVILQALLLLL